MTRGVVTSRGDKTSIISSSNALILGSSFVITGVIMRLNPLQVSNSFELIKNKNIFAHMVASHASHELPDHPRSTTSGGQEVHARFVVLRVGVLERKRRSREIE